MSDNQNNRCHYCGHKVKDGVCSICGKPYVNDKEYRPSPVRQLFSLIAIISIIIFGIVSCTNYFGGSEDKRYEELNDKELGDFLKWMDKQQQNK